ncbi:MAG: 30S ribosomal protein S20 [Prolixibacteraceae bacterium]|jgi:small subunit ribosomal protein S20|nr:30S ribosomal protein S20 [Prolixibacteraceae bacterium]HOO85183.1 30S ribosomal protein S20 [Prolixibacteraceae bacterium]
MANHKSAEKRIRQNAKRKLANKYYAKTMRNAVKKLRNTTEKEEAAGMYPKVTSLVDRLAKKNIIHKNKASNLKSKLAAHIAKL